jgi:hypothetical protein
MNYFYALFASVGILLVGGTLYMNGSDEDYSALVTACESEETRSQQCFNELVITASRESGVKDGFNVLADIYERDQRFAEYCHGATHEIGRVAYEYFRDGRDFELSDKTSYCGFGFYHGFIEELMLDKGDIKEASIFCEYADEKLLPQTTGTSFACYHGIGHGVVDGTDPSLWGDAERYIEPGLTLCDSLGDIEEHKERCASGVFNALALAYKDPKYGFDARVEDAYSICTLQTKRYAREACYDQMNGYVVIHTPGFSDALRIASHVEDLYVTTAVRSVASFRATKALAYPENLGSDLGMCDSLSTNLRNECAEGFGDGLIEGGKPTEEHITAVGVCAENTVLRDYCLRGVVKSVRQRFPIAIQKQTCAQIQEQVGPREAEMCFSMITPENSKDS